MEDTLRERKKMPNSFSRTVLILFLMEDTLRAIRVRIARMSRKSLNPCFNGRYSQRYRKRYRTSTKASLNPCFNGRYSQRILTS